MLTYSPIYYYMRHHDAILVTREDGCYYYINYNAKYCCVNSYVIRTADAKDMTVISRQWAVEFFINKGIVAGIIT